jgi:endonuclease/exonuclease/phosphatase (EEP) superfamily protein YafD
MAKISDKEAQKKREKIQRHFWNIVGSVEHINVPKLEDAIRKEFRLSEDRLVMEQVNLMQTEAKIRVESRVKVWIKQPETK